MSNAVLYEGDCIEIMKTFDDNSIDAILTDPPYPRTFQHLYGEIAEQAKRILKRGGSYMAIVPHYAMAEVLESVGRHLKYRWVMSMWQPDGAHPRMAMGIEVLWKPVVWWVKEAWHQGRGFVKDGFINEPPTKTYHKWEQSESWADYCLSVATRPGDCVLDPLLGGGTMGVACIKNDRNFIGIELDPSSYATAKLRIEKITQEQYEVECNERA